jgi:hypothetical protein
MDRRRDVFLEYLPEPIAQRFRLAARAFDDEAPWHSEHSPEAAVPT